MRGMDSLKFYRSLVGADKKVFVWCMKASTCISALQILTV